LSHPTLSVILPTKDRPIFLERALASLCGQTFTDFEAVVVNDGGCDVSGPVQAARRQGLNLAEVVHAAPRGLAAARNAGVARAKGAWLTYLDDDDRFLPQHLEVLVRAIGQSGVRVAYTDSVRVVETEVGGQWREIQRNLAMSEDFDRDQILMGNITPVINVMHHRDCWEAVGGFDESLRVLEDWDFWVRVSRRWDFLHVPIVTAEVRVRADGGNMSAERQALFPTTQSRIYHKIREAKVRGIIGAAWPTAEAATGFWYEPDWTDREWQTVVARFVQTFDAHEPVALFVPTHTAAEHGGTADQARQMIQQVVRDQGRSTPPQVFCLADFAAWTHFARAFRQILPITAWEPLTDGEPNAFKNRLVRALFDPAMRHR
jgi:hypothetical protein